MWPARRQAQRRSRRRSVVRALMRASAQRLATGAPALGSSRYTPGSADSPCLSWRARSSASTSSAPASSASRVRRTISSGLDLGRSMPRVRSVSTKPTCMPSTWVPCARSSWRRPLVSAQAADLLAPYIASIGELIQLATDSTLRIAPPPWAASTGAKAWLRRSGPKKLVSSCARADSMLSAERKPPTAAMPALLISSVTSVQRLAAAATSSARVTSSRRASTPGSVSFDGSRTPA